MAPPGPSAQATQLTPPLPSNGLCSCLLSPRPLCLLSQVLKRSGTEEEKRYAARIIPVIANEHFLLVTLLLCNAAANEVRCDQTTTGLLIHANCSCYVVGAGFALAVSISK